MALSDSDTGRLQLSPKLVRRFYEPVLLLHALDEIRGRRMKPATNLEDPDLDSRKARRAFTDGIAYICAYDKGPNFVTAVGLEKSPQGVDVWLAANNSIEQGVIPFLEDILQCLQQIGVQDNVIERDRAGKAAVDLLSSKITTFNTPKLGYYYNLIKRRYVQPCLSIIRELCNASGKLLWMTMSN